MEESVSRAQDELVIGNTRFPDAMIMNLVRPIFITSSNIPQECRQRSEVCAEEMAIHDQLDVHKVDLAPTIRPNMIACRRPLPWAQAHAWLTVRKLTMLVIDRMELCTSLAKIAGPEKLTSTQL